jgi:hypothetical protein
MRERWNLQKIQEKALPFRTRKSFAMNEKRAYSAACRLKIIHIVCSHMDSPKTKAWTMEELREEASKYKTKKDFENNSKLAYASAQKRKLLGQVCQHMIPQRKYWDQESLKREALKYNCKNDFLINSNSAYQIACKRNVLDQICQHMINSATLSFYEQDLFNLIKERYPKTQKFRDRKVEIANKPHIKGFDIDIYVPELRKGIEFDGKYYHSFGGLKRARPNWPDEDLRNYHQIKDEYFENKGIELLHITEEEWLKDVKQSLHKALDFLKNEH